MRIQRGVFIVAFLAGPMAFAAEDRISGPLEPAKTVVLKGQAHRRALPQNDRGPVDPGLRIDYATLLLTPAPGIEALLADQQNPSSPNYHRWLTPEQFADRFGLTGNDIGRVVGWLRSQGLKVNDVARGRHWITFSGTAAQVGAAFHTEIHRYQAGGEMHFANAGDLSIPAAFDGVVAGVRGLNDFRPVAMHTAPKAVSAPDLTSGSNHYLAPDDLATIYDLAALYNAGTDGTGQTIAVIGRTDVDLTDIRAFRSRFNLAPNDPQIMLVGPDPGTNSDDLVEADLDLEWSGAVARNATIVYVNSQDVDTSAQYAVDQNIAPVITYSYGLCEEEAQETLRSIAQQANAQGITWMAAAGDSAAATCDRSAETPQATKGLAVSYPASIPEITAMGGTEFNEGSGNYWSPTNSANQASALSYIPERVWNDSALQNGIIGGGGGASVFFAKPSWQTGAGVPNDSARDLPDVSITASADHAGYEFVNNGLVYIVGGTSASSPVFAGMVALLNQSLAAKKVQKQPGVGNINPALYRLAHATSDVFHDVTTGDNIVPCAQASPNCSNGSFGYTATAGYDLASGLGSVDAFHLVNEWSTGAASVTTLSASPASIAPGDTVQLTATVTAPGAIPSGSVTFVTNDTNLGNVALTIGTTTATATLSVSSAMIAAGKGTVSALYSGDTTFAPSTGSVNVPLKITPSASYVVPAIVPDPIYEIDGIWPFELTLTEKAGVATTITGLTVAGVNELSLLGSNRSLAANGSMSLFLYAQRLTPPTSQIVQFTGMDAGGQTWMQSLTVTYLPPIGPSIGPGMTLTGSPAIGIQQNPQTDPVCQGWLSRVTVQETGGFAISLMHFSAGTTSFDSSISQYFGTTRLAPFGSLTANVCLANLMAPTQKTFILSGTAEDGSTVTASFNASFAAPASSVSIFSVSAPSVTIPVADSTQSGSATLDLQFSVGLPQWTATVLPAARSTWLTVSALSGNGPGTITLQASGKGLANGVYNATLSIQSAGCEPQAILVPVVLVVGASSGTSVMGVGNAASGGQVFAPGQLLAVYGNNLASATLSAAIQPLPLTLAGTSATVNGVSAPLWFVSSGQMNIQIPYETGAGPAVLGVNNNGKVASFVFQAAPAGPGIFAYQGAMVPIPSATQGQTILGFITGDGDVTPTLASGATPPVGTSLSAFPQSRLPLTMTIGGEQANIVFHGIVTGLIGVTQINFTVPMDAKTGVQPVVVTVGGVSSAPVNLTVLPASGTN